MSLWFGMASAPSGSTSVGRCSHLESFGCVANATVEKDATSLGAGALGLHVPIARGRRYQLVAYGRALVPTETIFVSASGNQCEAQSAHPVGINDDVLVDDAQATLLGGTNTICPNRQ